MIIETLIAQLVDNVQPVVTAVPVPVAETGPTVIWTSLIAAVVTIATLYFQYKTKVAIETQTKVITAQHKETSDTSLEVADKMAQLQADLNKKT